MSNDEMRSCMFVCDLLTFLVSVHTEKTKIYLMNADIGNKIILLLEGGSTPLRVGKRQSYS